MGTSADIVIIGGGVIGLSLAWHLVRQGAEVAALDAGEPGQASQAAAGMLAPLAEAHAPGPFFDLALAGLRAYPGFLAELRAETGDALDMTGPGMLRVARTETEEAALCQALSWQMGQRLALEWLTGTEARRLEPELSGDVRAAMLSSEERCLEPRRLRAALQKACQARGVRIYEGIRAEGLEHAQGQITAVVTREGRFACKEVVIASGVWSGDMGGWLGVPLPVAPVRGQIVSLGPCIPSPIRHTIYAHGGYLVPRPDGRIVVGATEEQEGFAAQTTEVGVAGLLQKATALVPALTSVAFDDAWAGLRPVSIDGLPLLGRVPHWDNAFVATGHGRNGILLAPITGDLMAECILNGVSPPPAFDPARFGADA